MGGAHGPDQHVPRVQCAPDIEREESALEAQSIVFGDTSLFFDVAFQDRSFSHRELLYKFLCQLKRPRIFFWQLSWYSEVSEPQPFDFGKSPRPMKAGVSCGSPPKRVTEFFFNSTDF